MHLLYTYIQQCKTLQPIQKLVNKFNNSKCFCAVWFAMYVTGGNLEELRLISPKETKGTGNFVCNYANVSFW